MASVEPFAVEQLTGDMDPYACVECLAVGDSCPFHSGFAAGWDACVALVASVVVEREAA